MRRSEREITDWKDIESIFRRERIVRLGFAAGDEPYLVPVSYGYDAERRVLFLHTATAGRKTEFIARNPRVCFEVEGESSVRKGESACAWGLEYESLIGYGTLSEVLGQDEKRRALSCLVRQHGCIAGPEGFDATQTARTRIWRLTIESVTGKRASS